VLDFELHGSAVALISFAKRFLTVFAWVVHLPKKISPDF